MPTNTEKGCFHGFDAVQVFRAFQLKSRSATLDGSIPLRAAQGCKPFLDANEAGLHFSFCNPAMVAFEGNKATLRLSPAGFEAATHEYAPRIEKLVESGYLPRDSFWHRFLLKGFVQQDEGILRIWTGYMIRPAHGCWLLVSTAFNRRCVVNTREFVVSDSGSFVPVVLELDLSSLRHAETWLDTELATVTVLRPGLRVTMNPLSDEREIGQRFLDFYNPEYLQLRGEVKYTGRYRKCTAHLTDDDRGGADPVCRLTYCAGRSDLLSVGRFERFLTPDGITRTDPLGRDFEYGVTHALYDISVRWDGSNIRDISKPSPDDLARFFDEWSGLFGEGNLEHIRWWANYMMPLLGPHRGEPQLTISTWVLSQTPDGWSSLVDGYSFPNLDGMRGVIANDACPTVMPELQFSAPDVYRIPQGAPISRIIPVPRSYLRAEHGIVEL